VTLLLADIGNTRTKVAVAGRPPRIVVRDPAHAPDSWLDVLAAEPTPWRWAVAGVHPARVEALAVWAGRRGEECVVIRHHSQLPVLIRGPDPEQVGIDRLLDCCGANVQRRHDAPALVIDAGTAIVVNSVASDGAFLGGAIMPGVSTLFATLHRATAKLPLVDPGEFACPPLLTPIKTQDAVYAGCFHAVVGGVESLVRAALFDLVGDAGRPPDRVEVFVTGGDGERLASAVVWPDGAAVHVVETLTLEGLQLAAGFRA